MALTAGLLQSPYFLDFEGHERQEPEGRALRGASAFSRLYPAADGWLYVHCADEGGRWTVCSPLTSSAAWKAVLRPGLGWSTRKVVKWRWKFPTLFAAKPVSYWLERLNEAGIDAAENVAIGDFRDSPHVRKAGLIVNRDHTGRGMADHLGSTARLSSTPMRVGRPTPVLGSDADEILADAGLTMDAMASLKERGIVVMPE